MGISAYISIILNGILTGGVYGLFSSAFSFQAGALGYANFAYGAQIMISMYITYSSVAVWNLPLPLALLIVLGGNIILGYIFRKTALNNDEFGTQILCTMGISMIIVNLCTFFATAYPRDLAILEKRLYITKTISIGAIQLTCFVLAAVILLSFHFFLTKTWYGMAIRAVVEKKETAAIMGIHTGHILDLAFSISCCLIGISGIMLMTMFSVNPLFGDYLQTIAFIVCISAGLGNMGGAFFSGITIGVLSALITTILGSRFHDPLLFALFVVLLIIRPYGIFNSKKRIARSV
jgi:branched-chain amino acid transport system permease protein